MAEQQSIEIWKPVVGYEGYYEVSNIGRVRTLHRLDSYGRSIKGRIRKNVLTNRGYLKIMLSKDGKHRTFEVHRLVAQAFLGEPPTGKSLVLHWNDIPDDNRVENLRWGDDSENHWDSIRNGNHVNTNKTHCKHGHPLSGPNLYRNGNRRACRQCGNASARRYRESAQ